MLLERGPSLCIICVFFSYFQPVSRERVKGREGEGGVEGRGGEEVKGKGRE